MHNLFFIDHDGTATDEAGGDLFTRVDALYADYMKTPGVTREQLRLSAMLHMVKTNHKDPRRNLHYRSQRPKT